MSSKVVVLCKEAVTEEALLLRWALYLTGRNGIPEDRITFLPSGRT